MMAVTVTVHLHLHQASIKRDLRTILWQEVAGLTPRIPLPRRRGGAHSGRGEPEVIAQRFAFVGVAENPTPSQQRNDMLHEGFKDRTAERRASG